MPAEGTLKWLFFALIFAAVALEAVADILFKKWALEDKQMLLFLGLILYFAGTIVWAFSLRHEYLSKAISVFTIANLVVVTLAGALIFREELSDLNKLGIIAGIVSICLIEL